MDLELTFTEALSGSKFVIKVSVDVLPTNSPLKVSSDMLTNKVFKMLAYEGRDQNLTIPYQLIYTEGGLDLRNSSIDNVISLSLEPNLA